MRTLLLAALLGTSLIAQTYVRPVVTRTETVEIKTQSRVIRVELFADDPRAVRFVTRHAVEYEVGGAVRPSEVRQHERKLPANTADSVTITGTTLTRAQVVAFAVAFAERDRAEDVATGVPGTPVTATWRDNSSNETGFEIERSTDGLTFAPLGTTPANVTTYSDSTVTAGATYHYRVRATNDAGKSAFSNVASVVR